MGAIQSVLKNYLQPGTCKVKVTIMGLGGSGKTTILYRFLLNTVVNTIPTHGFNVETIHMNKVEFTFWDSSSRPLWRHYFAGTDAAIFVIDSSDYGQFEEAKENIWRIFLSEENQYLASTLALLVFANKQDLQSSMTVAEVKDALDLDSMPGFGSSGMRRWHVQGSSAITAEGLMEGMDWLAAQFKGDRSIPLSTGT